MGRCPTAGLLRARLEITETELGAPPLAVRARTSIRQGARVVPEVSVAVSIDESRADGTPPLVPEGVLLAHPIVRLVPDTSSVEAVESIPSDEASRVRGTAVRVVLEVAGRRGEIAREAS